MKVYKKKGEINKELQKEGKGVDERKEEIRNGNYKTYGRK